MTLILTLDHEEEEEEEEAEEEVDSKAIDSKVASLHQLSKMASQCRKLLVRVVLR